MSINPSVLLLVRCQDGHPTHKKLASTPPSKGRPASPPGKWLLKRCV